MKFDVIVGNPPYGAPNKENERGFTNTIWDIFVDISINRLLKQSGYLCLIHPPAWRKPEHKLWSLMSSKQIHYIDINGPKTGRNTFNCGTRYDWYVLENISRHQSTSIKDEIGNICLVNLSNKSFLPNYFFEEIYSLLPKENEEKCKIIQDSSYHLKLERISLVKTKKHIHPVFASINKGGILNVAYSSENVGHFDIPKVICNGNGVLYTLNDYKGEYGINCESFGIPVSSKGEGEDICKALNTKKFKEIVKATRWSNFRTEYKFFKCLKKDFWKTFLNE